jgi:hypothetical protein
MNADMLNPMTKSSELDRIDFWRAEGAQKTCGNYGALPPLTTLDTSAFINSYLRSSAVNF